MKQITIRDYAKYEGKTDQDKIFRNLLEALSYVTSRKGGYEPSSLRFYNAEVNTQDYKFFALPVNQKNKFTRADYVKTVYSLYQDIFSSKSKLKEKGFSVIVEHYNQETPSIIFVKGRTIDFSGNFYVLENGNTVKKDKEQSRDFVKTIENKYHNMSSPLQKIASKTFDFLYEPMIFFKENIFKTTEKIKEKKSVFDSLSKYYYVVVVIIILAIYFYFKK